MSRVRAARGIWFSLLVVAAVMAGPVSTASAAPRDLLPDLKMKPPVAMRITHQGISQGPNRRLLRFTARMVNTGDGPFTVRGKRAMSGTNEPSTRLPWAARALVGRFVTRRNTSAGGVPNQPRRAALAVDS